MRINYMKQSPESFKKLYELNNTVASTAISKELGHLVKIRASQLNGCAFCLDMHIKEAKIDNERELRIHHIAIWRESTLFTPREKAALFYTETLTNLPPHGVEESTFELLRTHFSDQEISDLTYTIMLINSWNRLSIAFKTVPGSADELYGLTKAGLN